MAAFQQQLGSSRNLSINPRFPSPFSSTVQQIPNISVDSLEKLELLHDEILPRLAETLRTTIGIAKEESTINDLTSLVESIGITKSCLSSIQSSIDSVFTGNHPNVSRLANQYQIFNQVLSANPIDEVQILFELQCLQTMLQNLLEFWKPERREGGARYLLNYDDDHKTVEGLPLLSCDDHLYQGGNIKVNINLSNLISSQYAQLLKSQEHSDVTFSINGSLIEAHRIILSAQSEYFDKLLFGGLSEAQTSHEGQPIVLKDVSLSSFKLLLCFAYTGCINLDCAQLQGVLELLETADRFCFVHLKDALAQQLSKVVSVSSVLPIFVIADHLDLKELCNCCLSFADLHASVILKESSVLSLPQETLMSLLSRDSFIIDELSIYNCIINWMNHNSISSENCQQLFDCVRLTEVPPDKLLDLAPPHGRFTEGQVLHALRVQMKKIIAEKKPRGICAYDRNLFDSTDTSSLVGTTNWKLAEPSLTSAGPPPPITRYGGLGRVRQGGIHGLPIPSPNRFGSSPSSMIYYGAPSHPLTHIILCGQLGMRQNQTPLIITVELKRGIHLINFISFFCYPDKPSVKEFGCSYNVEISCTGSDGDWVSLFKYSGFLCYGKQELRFPKQAIKYIRFSLLTANGHSDVTVKLLSCELETTPPQHSVYCDNGVLAPLDYIKPEAFQINKSSVEYSSELNIYFKTPLIITNARLTLVFPVELVESLPHNIHGVIEWGIEGQNLQEKETNFDINRQICFDFNGKYIVNVLIIKLKNVPMIQNKSEVSVNDLEVKCERQG